MKRRRITSVITASLLGLSVLPLLLLSAAAGRLLVTGMDQGNRATVSSLATSLALAAQRAMDPAGRALGSLGTYQMNEADPVHIHRFMDAVRSSRPEIKALALLDTEGRVLELSPGDRSRLGDDLSGQPGFAQAKERAGIAYSPPFVSSINREVTVACFESYGDRIGMLLLDLSSLSTQADLVRISKSDETAVIDASGRFIAHTKLENVLERRYAVQPSAPERIDRIDIDGSMRFVVAKPIPGIGWKVVYYRDARDFLVLEGGLLASLALTAALGVAAALLLTVLIRRMINQPFALIMVQLDALAAGRYGSRVEGDFPAELDAVVRELNSMADRVEARDRDLQKSEERYRAMFFGVDVPSLLIAADDGTIRDLNRAATLYYGWNREEMLRMRIWDVNTAPEKELRAELVRIVEDGSKHFAFRHRRKDGSIRDVETFAARLEIDGADFVYSLVFDVTERMRAQERVKRELEENTVLLKEIHHRVKNNLQIVSSLFYLQAETIRNEALRALLRTSEDRIYAMSLVHEIVYNSPRLSTVDMGAYTEQLLSWLAASHRVEGLVTETRVEEILLPLDRALSLGLLLNELVTNALVHGVPASPEKRLYLRIFHLPEEEGATLVRFEVEDRGGGLPPGLDIESLTTLGLPLAKNLASQLGGSLEFLAASEGSGLLARFTFPLH